MSTLNLSRMRRPSPRSLGLAAAILWVEFVVVGWYVLYAPGIEVTDPTILLYPIAWINASLLALWLTDTPDAPWRHRRIGAVIAVGYFVVLAYLGGLASLGHAARAALGLHPGGHVHSFGVSVAWLLPPGWGPMVTYAGSLIGVTLIPYKLLGYATLAYLVYVTILETAGSAWAGAVGLFSCVSCTWPVLGTVLASVFGSSAAVVAIARTEPYAASTLVFLSAVGLLLWRPFDRLSPGS
jgi:hypothetical protein